MAENILLIDQDASSSNALKIYLEKGQVKVFIASELKEVKRRTAETGFDILIADPFLQEKEIFSQIKDFKKKHPLTQIIILCEKKKHYSAMENIGSTATYFLERPVNHKALDLALVQARQWILNERRLINNAKIISDLQNAQLLYHKLFNEVPCYISVQDRNLQITAANTLFQRDFGTSLGAYCYEVYKHRTSPCPDCPVIQTFSDGLSHSTEEIVTVISGKQYNVLTQTAPIVDQNGMISQVMEISTNITQIRNLRDHLSSLGLMLGSMSHGVKGMLTALDGGIYQMETGLQRGDLERTEKAFDLIKQMAERIKKMVLEILYYAKSRELHYQLIDAGILFQTAISTVKPLADAHQVRIKTRIPESLGQIEADPNWLPAALLNLAENAVDACRYDKEKGKKFHTVSFEAWEETRENGKKPGISFSIADNGLGISQEVREKMFTLFFTSKGSQGTGLGLFIANQVIQQHGGEIQVDSTPGKGACFKIWLPKEKPPVSVIESCM